MADIHIKRIRTENGDLQIDYEALANLPKSDTSLSQSGKFADAKVVGDKIKEIKQNVDTEVETLNAVIDQHANSIVTTSENGHMSYADKNKLDNIEAGANNYILPIADASTIGGVKTASDITSADGLTPCPIVDGAPYYEQTTLNDLGVIATATELNKLSGLLTVAEKPKALSITLSTEWIDNKQTVVADGVTENNLVIVSSDPSVDNYNACSKSIIRCIAQGNGTLTFECKTVPTESIIMNVAIFA